MLSIANSDMSDQQKGTLLAEQYRIVNQQIAAMKKSCSDYQAAYKDMISGRKTEKAGKIVSASGDILITIGTLGLGSPGGLTLAKAVMWLSGIGKLGFAAGDTYDAGYDIWYTTEEELELSFEQVLAGDASYFTYEDSNIVRDEIFGGNETAYQVVRFLNELLFEHSSAASISQATSSKQPDSPEAPDTSAPGNNSQNVTRNVCDDPTTGTCFIAGTQILTADGLVSIEDIEAGDTVIATDPETGETAEKEVVETYENESDELVHIWVNGEEIITTPTHPFYVPEKGWTSAINLRAGDILVLVNGEYVTVEAVEHELLEEPVTVYNFQVEDFHTYYASEQSVLVHNTCPPSEDSTNFWTRNLDNTSDLNADDFLSLNDNGVVRVNASGSNRPLTGAPNSYYKTANGEHIFVYDGDGKLIYDISSSRVKGFKINIDPNGVEHYQPYKLEGAVPDAIKKLYGWI